MRNRSQIVYNDHADHHDTQNILNCGQINETNKTKSDNTKTDNTDYHQIKPLNGYAQLNDRNSTNSLISRDALILLPEGDNYNTQTDNSVNKFVNDIDLNNGDANVSTVHI